MQPRIAVQALQLVYEQERWARVGRGRSCATACDKWGVASEGTEEANNRREQQEQVRPEQQGEAEQQGRPPVAREANNDRGWRQTQGRAATTAREANNSRGGQ